MAKINVPEVKESESATLTLTDTGIAMGTLPYMSPEQLLGRSVDHRTDNFSLGAVLYETPTAQRPFLGEISLEVSSSILRDKPRPMKELRPELPTGLQRILDRCLSRRTIGAVRFGERIELCSGTPSAADVIRFLKCRV